MSIEAEIHHFKAFDNFYIEAEVFGGPDIQDELAELIRIRGPDGESMYRSNPHHCDLYQDKIYRDGYDKAHRCKILDFYCSDRGKGSLRLCVDILLIDSPVRLYDVWYDHIYDYAQIAQDCADIEPRLKPASLNIPIRPSTAHERALINKMVYELINSSAKLKISIDRVGRDYQHMVDVFIDGDVSLVSLIKDRFCKSIINPDPLVQVRPSNSNSHRNSNAPNNNNNNNNNCHSNNQNNVNYVGALESFKKRLRMTERDSSLPHAFRQFIKVKVICWYDPENISIIPYDADYVQTHKDFMKKMGGLTESFETSTFRDEEPYELDELIFFRNSAIDKKFGTWLRGRVVAISFYNQHGLSAGIHNNSSYKENYNLIKKMIQDNVIELDDVVYRIKSIDYGYHCRSSHFSMRHLDDETLERYQSIPQWSLSCGLYGVYPPGNDLTEMTCRSGYHSPCIGMMDSWIREKILDEGRKADFYLIFRTPIKQIQAKEMFSTQIKISLFHRYQPQEPYVNSMLLRKTYFQNLNWFLVDTGVASDAPSYEAESSKIQFEEYVVNKLLKHEHRVLEY